MIYFKKIRWKNLLSFGDHFVEMALDSHCMISVRGRNSAGKSAFLDALCFGLFGRPFRKINRPDLVNSRNSKDLVVEVWFEKDNHTFKIERGLNPQFLRIYKDDRVINQNSSIRDYQVVLERNILGVDFTTFTQIVVLGKASYISFMRLTPDLRRKFVENVLNLGIFGKMSEIHRMNLSTLKKEVDEFKIDFAVLKERVASQKKHIKSLEDTIGVEEERNRKHIESKIVEILSQISELETKVQLIKSRQQHISEDDIKAVGERLKALGGLLVKTESKLKDLKKQRKFFTDNLVCPSCHQDITTDLKERQITSASESEEKLIAMKMDISNKITQSQVKMKQINDVLEINNSCDREIHEINRAIRSKRESIKILEDTSQFDSQASRKKIEKERESLRVLEGEYDEKLSQKEKYLNRMSDLQVVSEVLGDSGIKKAVIRMFIPIINHTVDTFLRKLEFFVKFEMKEDFSERINIRGESWGYYSLSEGEKQKIDLGMLLAWRQVAKIRSNFSTNILIFDELLDGSIDKDGLSKFIEVLRSMSNTTTYIITHSSQYENSFDKAIHVHKNSKGFSELSEMQVTS